ncbi:PREDICTED: leucine-rich repeat-containing protein 15-like [Branchiostoma belcheri]|uniref:Leucine-rich repeat-containing protein 15-like n=1 Tax=Branchiostoma belcheri TaxID=7741 RepID=A0A6P5A1R4_BRABE|nr:PREDICTED: leucine-rich repeat-containing protein 15-like [Branchiostoma belcheri]
MLQKPAILLALLALSWELANAQSNTCPKGCWCTGRTVYCNHQHLTAIPTNIPDNTTQLNLHANNLSVVPSDAFEKHDQLSLVYLHSNNIVAIEDGAFSGLTNLMYLYLSENKLTKLTAGTFGGLNNLVYLFLDNNFIGNVESGTFSILTNLVFLHLRYNNLTALHNGTFLGPTRLNSLYLSGNCISYVAPGAFSGLQALRYLYLDNNCLTELPATSFEVLSGLYRLELSSNPITTLPDGSFKYMNLLKYLLMEDMALAKIEKRAFVGLSDLKYIFLQNNNLVTMDPEVFRPLKRVQELELNNNQLEELPPEGLAMMRDLTVLDVFNNSLQSLDSSVFPTLRYLHTLNLDTNPWNCTCQLKHFRQFLENTYVRAHLKCASPAQLAERDLKTVTDDELGCPKIASTLEATTSTAPPTKPQTSRTITQAPVTAREQSVTLSAVTKMKPPPKKTVPPPHQTPPPGKTTESTRRPADADPPGDLPVTPPHSDCFMYTLFPSVTNISSGSITLQWVSTFPYPDRFHIQYKPFGPRYKWRSLDVKPDVTQFVMTSLMADTMYIFCVEVSLHGLRCSHIQRSQCVEDATRPAQPSQPAAARGGGKTDLAPILVGVAVAMVVFTGCTVLGIFWIRRRQNQFRRHKFEDTVSSAGSDTCSHGSYNVTCDPVNCDPADAPQPSACSSVRDSMVESDIGTSPTDKDQLISDDDEDPKKKTQEDIQPYFLPRTSTTHVADTFV